MSTFKTPGVYIVELNVSPAPVVAAPTSVPVFIGYTPRAVDALGRDCTNRAMRITSYAEFAAMYLPENTTDFSTHYAVLPKSEVKGNAPVLKLGGQAFVVTPDPDTVYYTVNSVKMFFLNGGGPAYVISLGNYGPASGQFQKIFDDPIINKNVHIEAYLKAMALLEKEYEPAVCVMPDAVLSDSDGYAQVINAALTMAQDTGRYFCLFDIRCPVPPVQDNFQEAITQFRAAIAPQSDRNVRSYGACYFPWLNSTLYQDDVPDYRNIGDGKLTSLAELLAPERQENPALAGRTVAVNISGRHLGQPRVVEDVVSAHVAALTRAPDIGFARYIISATAPFSKDDVAALRKQCDILVASCHWGLHKDVLDYMPMIAHGDEVLRTQLGNNNGYCQDNELTWVDWDLDDDARAGG